MIVKLNGSFLNKSVRRFSNHWLVVIYAKTKTFGKSRPPLIVETYITSKLKDVIFGELTFD